MPRTGVFATFTWLLNKWRFADRLRSSCRQIQKAQEALVPQLILQPIVENAIRHGIGRSSSAGRVLITASRSMVRWNFEFRTTDLGFCPGMRLTTGASVWPTHAPRLRQLYGEDARLEIKNCDRGGDARP